MEDVEEALALYGDELCYFKSPMDLYDAGRIKLKTIVDAQFNIIKDTPDGWQYAFKLFEVGRVWLLACQTEEEMCMWKTQIVKAAKLRHRMAGGRDNQKKRVKVVRQASVAADMGVSSYLPPMPPPSDSEGDDADESEYNSEDEDAYSYYYSDGSELSTPPGTPPMSPISSRKSSAQSIISRCSTRSRTISSLERYHAMRVQNARPRLNSFGG